MTTMRRRGSKLAVLVLLIGAASGFIAWSWPEPTVDFTCSVPPDARQVNVLVIGDWGDDTRAQARVADGMAAYADERVHQLDAVLTVGDNFYVPIAGVDDPTWDRLFEKMFDPKRLGVPFYAILGNHDYSGGREDRVELEYAKQKPGSRWKMPGRWYRLELPSPEQPLVTFLMLDSNYLFLSADEWRQQTEWLNAELAKPRTARWLVVCAHHPLYSNGGHHDDKRLIREWGPLLEKHAVGFYLAGHDHNMQHLKVPGLTTTFLVSGGGGASTHTIERTDRGPYAREIHGFLHLRFSDTSADIHILDQRGRPVHAFISSPLLPMPSATTTATTTTFTAAPETRPLHDVVP